MGTWQHWTGRGDMATLATCTLLCMHRLKMKLFAFHVAKYFSCYKNNIDHFEELVVAIITVMIYTSHDAHHMIIT